MNNPNKFHYIYIAIYIYIHNVCMYKTVAVQLWMYDVYIQ